jgi:thiamine-monophosphate kinase
LITPNREPGAWESGTGELHAVSNLSERELIARIRNYLPPAPDWLVVGVGDDAAVVEPVRNQLDVLSVDALVEGVHFDRRFTPPDAIGHRAMAVNLSDLAAMGASPRLALVSLALPTSLPLEDFDAIVKAIVDTAARHRVHVAGGNLTRSPGPLVVDVTVTGTVKRRQLLTRSGARAGDEIYVSGSIGAAAAGLGVLRSRVPDSVPPAVNTAAFAPEALRRASPEFGGNSAERRREDTKDTEGRNAPKGLSTDDAEACIARYLYPEARVRLGTLLGRNRAASACMDLSDGLADGLRQLAEASGVGVTIDADAVPIDAATRAWFEQCGTDPLLAALAGGDDYELLITVRPRFRRRLEQPHRHGGVPLTRIGVCTPGPSCLVQRRDRGRAIDEPLPSGFAHFR